MWHVYSDYEAFNARDVSERQARAIFDVCKRVSVPCVLFHGIQEIARVVAK